MHGQGRSWIRISHAAVLTAMLMALGVLLIGRANWRQMRTDFATSFRLFVALQPAIPEGDVQRALADIEALPEIRSVRVRDREADQRALFEREPWVEPYRQTLRTHFLPVVLEVSLADPFVSESALRGLAGRIERLDSVDAIVFSGESQGAIAEIVHTVDQLILAVLGAMALGLFLISGALEYLRARAEAGQPKGRWLPDRALLAGVACVLGAAGAVGLAMAFARHSGASVALLRASDGILLAACALMPALAWALAIQGLRVRPAAVRQAARNDVMAGGMAESPPAPKTASGTPASVRAAYSRQMDASAEDDLSGLDELDR